MQADQYDAARTGAALYRVPDPGLLRISGADRETFIQRQTTNDAHLLAPGRAQWTVLTSPTARILDVWQLIPAGEVIDVITLPGRGAATARYLKSRIFFMDKVTLEDTSAGTAQIEIGGPRLPDLLRALGPGQPPAPGDVLDLDESRAVGLDGGRVLLLAASGAVDQVEAALIGAGAERIGPALYDLLRIEAGRPGPAGELTEDYTPLETGLDAAISDTKGCYTGQEIIARQITYDKVTRQMVGVRLDAPAVPGTEIEVEGRRVGAVTSAAVSPRFGPIALAVIRRPHHAPGTAIAAGETRGVIAALPFE